MIVTAYRVHSQALYCRNRRPVRDEAYLRWIRQQPSVVSGKYGCQACHTGAHGIGQKSSDFSCIPLTWKEHKAYDADPRGFAAKWRLNVEEIVKRLNWEYEHGA